MVFGWNRKKYNSRHSKKKAQPEKSVQSTAAWKSDKKSTWERRPRRHLVLSEKNSEERNQGKSTPIAKIPEAVQTEESKLGLSLPQSGEPPALPDASSGKTAEKKERRRLFGRSKWERRERKKNVLVSEDSFLREQNQHEEEYLPSPRITYSPELMRQEELEKSSSANEESASERLAETSPPPPKPKKKVPLWVRIVQFLGALLIFAGAVAFSYFWTSHSDDDTLPAMTMPQSYLFEEDKNVRAILLWHETVLRSSVSGSVQLASGGKIAAVAAKDIVATVMSKGKSFSVTAPSRGYFVPALDGAEGSWDYGSLWAGSEVLPEAPEVKWIKDLSPLPSGKEVGKLIKLPQSVRAVFYLDLTDALERAVARGTLYLRREAKGPKWAANVRVYMKYGISRAKVVVDMPYFSIDMAQSRETSFLVCAEEVQGLAVPESAVVIRKGSWGVFELVGDRIIFRPVNGKPIGGGRFFISSGLSAGNPVILDAANAEEKRVRLW